jgi:tRNA modification GTPase
MARSPSGILHRSLTPAVTAMFSPDDTIVAPATPPGRGGLAVVRLSGPQSASIASGLIEGPRPLQPRVATLVRVRGLGAEAHRLAAIDEAIATFFPAGASYTGEDVVEFSLHGSPVVVGELVAAAVAAGARLARAGEFTLRAFLNGRLDLTRAEAVRDLVEATTPAQARAAFDQLSGTLAERIGELDAALFDVIARLEASGDFPEEGYLFISREEARAAIEGILERADRLLADGRRGRLIRDGVSVAIVGRPNVGKSTLFNRLAGAERAIVTEFPGTTRDVLTEAVVLLGTRMLLADTAGLRESADPIEREGVQRAKRATRAADVVVIVLDGSEPLREEDRAVLHAAQGRPRIIAANKWDVGSWTASVDGVGQIVPEGESGCEEVRISALTGAGVDSLVRAIAETAGLGHKTETVGITNDRHIALLGQAAEALRRAAGSLDELGQTPEEFVLSDLHEARGFLEEISGKRSSEDVLDAIFSKFCIGK